MGYDTCAMVVLVVGMAYRLSCCAMPKLSTSNMCWRLSLWMSLMLPFRLVTCHPA